MKKQNIAFDLDGVLIDIMKQWNIIAWREYGAERILNGEFRIKTEPYLSSTTIWKIFYEVYDRWKETEVYEGAQELLTKLYERTGQPPLIVTARPINAATPTYKVVNKFLSKIPYNLILTQGFEDKLHYLRDYAYFVDDRRKTALSFAAEGIHMLVPRRHYNEIKIEDPVNIEYIDGVQDLIPRIDEFIYQDTPYYFNTEPQKGKSSWGMSWVGGGV